MVPLLSSKDMSIRILPPNIANLIAAGEVVQRPASVVKELVENAVDAGATDIKVIVTDAGRTLIQVVDNGCGMTRDEAEICFERHATSKISSAEDLSSISSFGFRGEALASIAAVAEVTLRTRKGDEECGWQVEFAAGEHVATSECAKTPGTSIAVRNLFYNVPARRKFLKSDNVELRHIVEEFTRVALTRPEVAFTLMHNDKELYVLRAVKSLKIRIKDLLGEAETSKVMDIDVRTAIVRVSGFICRPDSARKMPGSQFFFVNGRFFRSAYFHKAVMKAYENLLAPGTLPSYFLWLETDPRTIDVNIHPTKTEVKFEGESEVFQIIFSCVKEALGRNTFGGAIDFTDSEFKDMPVFSKHYERLRPEVMQPNVGFDPDYNPFETHGEMQVSNTVDFPEGPMAETYGAGGDVPGMSTDGDNGFAAGAGYGPDVPAHDGDQTGVGYATGYHTADYIDSREDYGKLFEDKILPTASTMVLKGRFILMPVASGLLVVHIARALNRIYYERFLKTITGREHIAQATLIPVQVQVGTANRLIFDEHSELLENLGFDIAPFGNDTVVVNGVPEGFSCEQSKVEEMLANVLIILLENYRDLPGLMESALAEKMSALASNGAKSITSPVEAQRLMDCLYACDNSEFTSKGLRIMALLPIDDIEKRF